MDLSETPPGFAPIPPGALDAALAATREALNPVSASPFVRFYYDRQWNFAGATFVEALAGPTTAPDDLTAADLFAVALLTAKPPHPYVARQILDPGARRSQLLRLLHSEHLAAEIDIAYADDATMLAMREFYEELIATNVKDEFDTAGALCSRKRPGLFPVRDPIVREFLGLAQYDSYEIDWQVFRAIMLDHEIVESLHEIRQAAQGVDIGLDVYPLRWLEVALWMHARDKWPHALGNGRR
jgi:hypothetical protein